MKKKVLIKNRVPCEYCEWGKIERITDKGFFTTRGVYEKCPMCEGKGIVDVTEVVEVDEDLR